MTAELPECPSVAVELPGLNARDWALSDEELRKCWAAVQKLRPLKRAFWLTLSLAGARRESVRVLRWKDVDFEKNLIRFSTAKASRSCSIPMPERLAAILIDWRGQAPPSV